MYIVSFQKPETSAAFESGIAMQALDPIYTVLLLTGTGHPAPDSQAISHIALNEIKIETELLCIADGLEEVIKRWTALSEYPSRMLAEDFMEPKKYVKLLFDDENFSPSQKYFWAIGCLGEFDISITNNIKQCDLFYAARVKPLLDILDLADRLNAASLTKRRSLSSVENGLARLQEFKALFNRLSNHRESLVDLQTQFRNILETVKALRDRVRLCRFC